MPCRHAVLCEECAKPVLDGKKPCPVCEVKIESHAFGNLAADYADLVQKREEYLEEVADLGQAVAQGVSYCVKPLMLTGSVLAAGATACFVVNPPMVPVYAAGAFAVGYVPWFLHTKEKFEKKDPDGGESVLSDQRFFTKEDLSKPLRFIGKIITLAVVAPLAAVAFYIPYGMYRASSP